MMKRIIHRSRARRNGLSSRRSHIPTTTLPVEDHSGQTPSRQACREARIKEIERRETQDRCTQEAERAVFSREELNELGARMKAMKKAQ